MDPDDVIGMVIPLLIILGIGAAIAGGVYMVQTTRRGEKLEFPTRALFRLYLTVLSIVSLLLMVGGLGHMVNAGMSAGLSRDFSYYPLYSGDDYPPRPIKIAAAPESPTLAEELTVAEQEALRAEEEALQEDQGLGAPYSYKFNTGVHGGVQDEGIREVFSEGPEVQEKTEWEERGEVQYSRDPGGEDVASEGDAVLS